MKNVLDIRSDKGLYFVLPEEMKGDGMCTGKVGVIACLYYKDDLDRYLSYLDRIPCDIVLYIVSSNIEILDIAKRNYGKKGNVRMIKKENRGRDISALLVTCRKIFFQYDFLCFVHDKKEKSESKRQSTAEWTGVLWDSMVKSPLYIENILAVFEANPSVGMLVPPEPINELYMEWCKPSWGGKENFEWVCKLAQKMALKCDIDPDKPAFTFGTVFWCRTAALKKLLEIPWKYEDFDPEPLADNGTLSHGIERILAYVAQDAGYDTGTVMTCTYAEKILCYLQKNIRKTVEALSRRGIFSFTSFDGIDRIMNGLDRLKDYCARQSRIYVYGAGILGKRCLRILKDIDYAPVSFVMTQKEDSYSAYDGIGIIDADSLQKTVTARDKVIVAVRQELEGEIVGELEKRKIGNYVLYRSLIESFGLQGYRCGG